MVFILKLKLVAKMSDIYLQNAIDTCNCSNVRCPDPYSASWSMPDALVDVYYRKLLKIPGSGAYDFELIEKPEWVEVFFDQVTGRIRIEGTPTSDDIADEVEIKIKVANCGRALDETGVTLLVNVIEPDFQLLVDSDLSDVIDYDGTLIETE